MVPLMVTTDVGLAEGALSAVGCVVASASGVSVGCGVAVGARVGRGVSRLAGRNGVGVGAGGANNGPQPAASAERTTRTRTRRTGINAFTIITLDTRVISPK